MALISNDLPHHQKHEFPSLLLRLSLDPNKEGRVDSVKRINEIAHFKEDSMTIQTLRKSITVSSYLYILSFFCIGKYFGWVLSIGQISHGGTVNNDTNKMVFKQKAKLGHKTVIPVNDFKGQCCSKIRTSQLQMNYISNRACHEIVVKF